MCIYICVHVYIYIYIYVNKYTPTNACIDTQTRCGGMLRGKFVMQNCLKADHRGVDRGALA